MIVEQDRERKVRDLQQWGAPHTSTWEQLDFHASFVN